MNRTAIIGHSFGGATAIATSAVSADFAVIFFDITSFWYDIAF